MIREFLAELFGTVCLFGIFIATAFILGGFM